METYTALRTFADSWHLLFMFVFFIGMVIFLFRPGSRRLHDESANMIFRNDDRPAAASDDEDRPAARKQGEAR
ncbi:MAG: cbb3-type cytochrome c oxidase subunit 3 [Alkalilacustris sp.]